MVVCQFSMDTQEISSFIPDKGLVKCSPSNGPNGVRRCLYLCAAEASRLFLIFLTACEKSIMQHKLFGMGDVVFLATDIGWFTMELMNAQFTAAPSIQTKSSRWWSGKMIMCWWCPKIKMLIGLRWIHCRAYMRRETRNQCTIRR